MLAGASTTAGDATPPARPEVELPCAGHWRWYDTNVSADIAVRCNGRSQTTVVLASKNRWVTVVGAGHR